MVVPPGPSCAVAGPSTLTALAGRSRVTIAASPGPTTVGVTDTIFGVVAVAKLSVTVCSLSPPEEGGDEEPEEEEEPGGRDAVAVTVYRASGWRDPSAMKPSAVSEPAIASPPSRVSVTRVRWASENFVATMTGSFGLTSMASRGGLKMSAPTVVWGRRPMSARPPAPADPDLVQAAATKATRARVRASAVRLRSPAPGWHPGRRSIFKIPPAPPGSCRIDHLACEGPLCDFRTLVPHGRRCYTGAGPHRSARS